MISGLPTDRFSFEGFLTRKRGDRMRRLEALRDDPRTLVVFESPLRVQNLLRDLLVAFGDRRIAVARELTKLHEEVFRGRVSEVLSRLGLGKSPTFVLAWVAHWFILFLFIVSAANAVDRSRACPISPSNRW